MKLNLSLHGAYHVLGLIKSRQIHRMSYEQIGIPAYPHAPEGPCPWMVGVMSLFLDSVAAAANAVGEHGVRVRKRVWLK